jgi:cation diffusion facilitator family transporter
MNNQKSRNSEEPLPELKKLVDIAFYSLIPLTVLFVVTGILSNSMTILAVTFDCGLSLIVQLFAFRSIRTIVKSNVMKFPYGTGKLENFSAIVYGSLAIPTSLFIIYSSIIRFITPPAISFSIAQIPMIPSLVRSIGVFRKSRQLMQASESPMVNSYYVNFKVSSIIDTSVVTSLSVVLLLVNLGQGYIAYFIDPTISSLLGAYMLFNGVTLTIENFKVLIDLPLPEDDQLKIMAILAQEYSDYENIGNIYTRFSGKTRFIELELYLRKNLSLEEITTIGQRIENRLRQHFRDLRFVLIPLYEQTSSEQAAYSDKKEEPKSQSNQPTSSD